MAEWDYFDLPKISTEQMAKWFMIVMFSLLGLLIVYYAVTA